MKELIINFLNMIPCDLNILILSYLLYRIIQYMFKKLNIRDYSYNGNDENADNVEIIWFSEKDISGNKSIYRFKDNKSSLLIFINKYEITFCDKIRLICYFHKSKNKSKKELPEFFVKKYIFPKLTQEKYNRKSK